MRYAILSDIHGNLEALKAVVEDIKKENIDRIICLGDTISKGSHGHECVEIVKNMCDAVVCGNNDIKYTKGLDEIAKTTENFDYDYFYWNQRQLTNEDILFLRKLPLCCEFYLSGRLVRCFHATPSDIDKSVFNFEDYETKLQLFAPTENTTNKWADVVVYGHIHHVFYEKLFGRILINAGSVGNSLNIVSDEAKNAPRMPDFTMAEYLVLNGLDGENCGEIGVEIKQVPYNKEKELSSFNNKNLEDVYTNEILNGKYRKHNTINIPNLNKKSY